MFSTPGQAPVDFTVLHSYDFLPAYRKCSTCPRKLSVIHKTVAVLDLLTCDSKRASVRKEDRRRIVLKKKVLSDEGPREGVLQILNLQTKVLRLKRHVKELHSPSLACTQQESHQTSLPGCSVHLRDGSIPIVDYREVCEEDGSMELCRALVICLPMGKRSNWVGKIDKRYRTMRLALHILLLQSQLLQT